MKTIISNFLLLASLIVISYIFNRCGSKSVVIIKDQPISEWREENRTGVSAETGLLESWPESGPELIWSNNDLPMGYSSVSFGNNTIYVTGNDQQNDILVAIDTYGKTKDNYKYEYITN